MNDKAWTSTGKINLTTLPTDLQNADSVVGIKADFLNYNNRKTAPASMTALKVDTPDQNFVIKLSDTTKTVHSMTGIALGGQARDDDNSSYTYSKSSLDVNAADVTIALESTGENAYVYGVSSSGWGDQKDLTTININASGKLAISTNVHDVDGVSEVFAVNSNSAGTINLTGSSIDISAAVDVQTQGVPTYGSTIDAINAFHGMVNLNATAGDINLSAKGNTNSVITLDIMNKGVTQIKYMNGQYLNDKDVKYTEPTTVQAYAQNGRLLVSSESTSMASSIGVLGRYYSWVNGDMTRYLDGTQRKDVFIDLKASQDLLINSTAAKSGKVAGVILDVEKTPDGSNVTRWQSFVSENGSVVIAGKNETVNNSTLNKYYHHFLGHADVAAVELLSGAISINAAKNVDLSADVTNMADCVRAFESVEKSTNYEESNHQLNYILGDLADKTTGKHLTYLSNGDSIAKVTAGEWLNVTASAGTAEDVQAVSWRSTGEADFTGKGIKLAAATKTGNGTEIAALDQENGTVTLNATDALVVSASNAQGTEQSAVYGLHVANGTLNSSSASLAVSAADTGKKAAAFGLYAGSATGTAAAVTHTATAGNMLIEGDTFGVFAEKNGTITIDGSKSVDSTISNIAAVSNGTVEFTAGTGLTKTDILATDGGKVTMKVASGTFLGSTENYAETTTRDEAFSKANTALGLNLALNAKGEVKTEIGETGTWQVTKSSWLDGLTVEGGTLDLASHGFSADSDQTLAAAAYRTVTTDTFSKGNSVSESNGTIKLRIDMKNESVENKLVDQLVITDATASGSSGKYKVDVVFTGADLQNPKAYSENFLVRYGAGNAAVAPALDFSSDPVSPNGAAYSYRLAYFDDQSKLTDETERENAGTEGKHGYWHLVLVKPEAPEIETMENVGTSYGQYLAWRSDLTDLRHRLGEIRYGSQTGAWIKGIYDRERGSGVEGSGFKQETYGVHFGADGYLKNTEDAMWLLGGSLKFAHSDQKSAYVGGNGDGDLDAYTGKLYASYAGKSGAYADFVASLGWYDQDITGRTNQNDGRVTAGYDTYGWGLSVEAGHMISFGEQVDDRHWYNHWFIEPQLQLAYYHIKGKDWDTSTSMHVSQEDVDSLIGRAGVVLGKKFNYGGIDDLQKRYFQIAARAGVIREFMGEQTVELNTTYRFDADLGGTTYYYYGLEGDWQFARNQRFYLNVDREEGHDYTNDVAVRFGYRLAF